MLKSEIPNSAKPWIIHHMIDYRQYLPLLNLILENPDGYPRQLEQLVRLAQAYLSVDTVTIQQLAVNTQKQYLLKPNDLELRTYAYAHYMNHQFEQKEYMDYFRGLSPLLVDLFRLLIAHDFLPNLKDYIEPIMKLQEDGREIYKGLHWKQEVIESRPNPIAETWKKYYGEYFNYKHYVSSSHLIKLIEDHASKSEIREKCHQLRQIEKNIRNIVAHEAIYVSDELIEYRSGHTIEEIHYLLQEVCLLAGLTDKSQWAVLNELDKDMKELIN